MRVLPAPRWLAPRVGRTPKLVDYRRVPASVVWLACLMMAAGCASVLGIAPDPATRLRNAAALAAGGGFERLPPARSSSDALPVAAWIRPGSAEGCVRVYVEGDGLAWKSRRRVSPDPTPVDPVGLRLALADHSSATLIYLGRPCQYRQDTRSDPRVALREREARDAAAGRGSGCHPIEWTAARFGEPSLAAMQAALNVALNVAMEAAMEVQQDPAHEGFADPDLTLVGFSGGGVVAALLAAQRQDVDRLVTIAAPLDIEGWSREIGASPLAFSRTPMDELPRLRVIAQDHFIGERDRRVPASAVRRYQAALESEVRRDPPRSANAPSVFLASRVHLIPRQSHRDWPGRWTELLRGLDLPCAD